MPSDDSSEIPREIAGYALEEKLARGRAGVVYRARDPEGKHFALRTFGGRLEPLAPKAQERLEDVYKRLEQVMHASVPKVVEQGKHEDRPYVVLQHTSGERLDRILEDQRLPVEQVLQLGKTLADALTAAHTVGLVHTDVCARTVVIGKDPACMLLGWSAARPLGAPLGKDVPRASLRPPDGEAPEAPATPQLDVFALGALLYEALAYAPPRPYDPAAPAALRAAWPLRRLNPTLSLAVETVIAKAIDPDPRQRYGQAADFAADLAALCDKRAPRALRGRHGRALVRAARRRPVLFGGGVLAISVLCGLLAAVLGAATARKRRIAAEVEAVRTALAKGSIDRAELELARAREDDPKNPYVLEAVALVERARLDAARRAHDADLDAQVARAESEAKAALERARKRRSTLPALEERVRLAASRAEPLASPDGPEKRALEAARTALEEAARDEARSLGEAVSALRRALALDPDRAATSALLVEALLDRCAGLEAPRELERGLRAYTHAAVATVEGRARPARLVVAATPAGVTCSIAAADGAARPLPLPAEVDVPAGEVTLTFQGQGLAPQTVLVPLEPARASRVKVALVAAPASGDDIVVPGIELELPPSPLPLAGTDVERAGSAVARAAAPTVAVPPALVARALVTCGEYAAFLRAKGGDLPADRDGKLLFADVDAVSRATTTPVTGVSLEQALAYARWRGRRLPTRAELWAARARGAEGDLREWTAGPEGAHVLDLRGEREVVGDERVAPVSLRARDLGFRLAESVR